MNEKPLFEKGDTVAVIGPAAPAEPGIFDDFMARYPDYNFVVSPLTYDVRDGIDEEHAREIEKYFTDPDIKAILCGRGGYGTIRRLNLLDYGLIRKNHKPFFGFSDITALQMALYRNAGLKSYTGLILRLQQQDEENAMMLSSFEKTVSRTAQSFENIELRGADAVKGEMIGGNLATLTALVGTPYLPDFKGKILVLEDVDEKPYKIDRMLYQLYYAGVFKGIKALVFGTFFRCVHPDHPEGKTVWSYIDDFTKKLDCPVAYGLPYGHQAERMIFGFDAVCEIAENKIIIF